MKFVFNFFGYTRFFILAFTLFLIALSDLIGIVILYPYIELAMNPDATVERLNLQPYLDMVNVSNSYELILLAGLSLIILYSLKLIFVFFLNRYQFKVLADLTYRLTETLFKRLLRSRYNTFQQFPASQLIGVVFNNPMHATLCLTAIATLLNDLFFLGMVLVISLIVSPMITCIVLLILLVVAVSLNYTVVRWTQSYGKQQSLVENAKHKITFATISAIKDIKVMGIEQQVIDENTSISKQYFNTTWKFNLLASMPKAVTEFVALAGLTICIILLTRIEDSASLFPLIGVGLAALLRILPAFQRIISSIHTYKFYSPFVTKITDFNQKTKTNEVEVANCPMPFERTFEIKGLNFSYGKTKILDDVSITIRKGQSIGIVGMSGAGKSTLLDLLSGIQHKSSGEFCLDEKPVDPFNTNVIRRMLGYVPQSIALVDDSIAFNITFSRNWDTERLRNALRVSNLLSFVEQLPDKERTSVGENGVRVSGGQRQRIGIARALYKEPEILIFDEATSAVDNITERELNSEIRKLAGLKTSIMVAHRLSTIRYCDCIYVMEKGRISGMGSYEQLLETNPLFLQLHNQQSVDKSTLQPILSES